MTDFLAAEDRALQKRLGLGTFDALWVLLATYPDQSQGGSLIDTGSWWLTTRRSHKEMC
jgi:hypothetical protein